MVYMNRHNDSMTATEDLTSWLRAQLDDDEAYARNAFGDHNQAEPEWTEIWSGAVQVGPNEDVVLTNDSQVSRHMVRHDPARVLREVEAKRLLLELHTPYPHKQVMARGEIYACSECGDVDDNPTEWPCDTLRLLALPYSDHPGYPGYRDEWRP